MAKCHGIYVDNLINQEPQRIYDNPELEDNPTRKVFYVKAITDAKFAVKVTLEPEFDFLDADGCRIIWVLDGKGWYRYVKKETIHKATSSRSSGHTEIFTKRQSYDSEAHLLMEGELSFGILSLLEFTDNLETPATFKNLGKIQVLVERVNTRRRAIPNAQRISEHKLVTQVSETVLKGQAIDNSIRIVDPAPAQPLRAGTKMYKPLPGFAGQGFGVDIVYRSKKALQSLGCIPKAPYPTPELGLLEELKALKERNGILERIQGIKAEPSECNQGLTATESGNTIRVKRERLGEVEKLSCKCPRMSEIEFVDLTGD